MEYFKNTRNPILPLEHHTPDCEAHVMSDGKLYIYGSYDSHQTVYCSDKYHVVSTPDMENWTIHEVAFRADQAHWCKDPNAPKYAGIDWSKPTPFLKKMLSNMPPDFEKMMQEKKREDSPEFLLFAPDAIEKDGKYYLYFCLNDQSEGVAVSDRPEGPFGEAKQLMCGGIDPAIFMDDDGQAYYFWGQLFGNGAKLMEDMMTIDPSTIVENLITEEEHYFHEGSSMRKRGDTYYLVYCNIEHGKPTSLGYSTSKSPLGPFTYQGVIIDNDGCDPASWNNHGSIEEFNGQWYVFYHRCSRGVEYNRRLCIEPIYFNEDGTINEVKMTSQGLGKPFGPEETIMAYHTCGLTGTAFLSPLNDTEVLTSISDQDTATFRYVESTSPFTEAVLEVEGKGTIELLFDGKPAGVAVAEGNGQTSCKLTASTGKHELTLRFLKPEDLNLISLKLV